MTAMALDPKYQRYAYLARFGQNRQTVSFLIEVLSKSGAGLSPTQTILIPGLDGNPPQEIPVSDVVSFIHEWCDVALNFSEGDLKRLDLGIYTSPRTTLASISAKINVSSKSPEHLLTGRLQANLAELERSNKLRELNVDPTTRFDPTAAIKKYNAQVLSLENIATRYKTSFEGLTQPGLINSEGQQLTGDILQGLIVNHLSDLESTRQLALSRYRNVESDTDRAELVGAAVATTLNNYLHREHPDFGSYNLYDAVPDVERRLGMLVSTISNTYEAEGGSFADLAQSRTQAAQAAAITYASRGELYLQLVAKLQGSMDQAGAAKTAERIVRELTTTSSPTTSVRALIKQAAQKTGIANPDSIIDVIVEDELLAGSLAYQQAAAHNTQLHLGSGLFEGQLRGNGIDATYAHKSKSEHQTDYERLLGQKAGDSHEARINAINQALQSARSKPLTPGVFQEIQDLGSLLTQEFYLKASTRAEKGWAQTVKRAEWLNDLRGRVNDKQLAFSKFIYEIEEKMPWNKAFRWGGEQVEKAGNWINKRTGLPLYGFFGKVAEEIGKFKYNNSIKILKSLRGTASPLGKIAQFSVRHYIKGDLTFSGGWFSGSRELLGRGYRAALARATSSAAYKGAAVWGNKAIAGLMAKLSPAIISAGGKLAGYAATVVAGVASGIGIVASVVGIAATVIDFVIKPLVGFVKKFFSDPGFAALSVAIGGALTALSTIPALIGGGITALIAGLGGALAGLAALFTTALLWSLGAIILVAVLFKTFDMTTHLDPGNPASFSDNMSLIDDIIGGRVSNCKNMDLGDDITADLAGQLESGVVNLLPEDNWARNEKTRWCIKPTMIIIHWSGAPNTIGDAGNSATYNTLVSRVIEVLPGQSRSNVLACHLGTDTGEVMFMQPMYQNGVEMSQCAGEYNSYAIQNEISGTNFTDSPNGPPDNVIFDRAIEVTCLMMKTYGIPSSKIIGHYQVPNNGGKTDPGAAFLQNRFIPAVNERCK
jgi:hypothetical protein